MKMTEKRVRPLQAEILRLEDRIVPGELLGASLLWAMGSFAGPALLAQESASGDLQGPALVNPEAGLGSASAWREDNPATLAVCPPEVSSSDVASFPLVSQAAPGGDSQASAITSRASDQVFAANDNSLAALSPSFDFGDPFAGPLPSAPEFGGASGGTAFQPGTGGSADAVIPATSSLASGGVISAPAAAQSSSSTGAGSGMQAAAASGGGGVAAPQLVAHPTHAPGGIRPNGANGSAPFSPAQISQAYGFNLVSNTGAGQTIFIVDAYNDPNIARDLKTFDAQWGLPNPTLTVHEMSSRIHNSASWGIEESLDVEWAHAIAPQANITLVEATSSSYTALFSAINWATTDGAHVVSMSWGGSDSSSDSSYDSYFSHMGVSYVASAGDSGGVVEYPSASPNVLSVGGTSLTLTTSNAYSSESAWSSGGGGASAYEPEPGYQSSYGINLSGRGTPDVSYDANPSTGVYVYDSYTRTPGWYEVGGTSAGAPQWAGLIALVNQSRSTPLSTNNLTSRTEYNAAVGSVYATNYHDVITGSNGYAAGPGYDLATGLGSPQANTLVPWLIANS